MSWVDEKPFAASFYFRDIGPAKADLTFEIEGPEPVYLSDLQMRNAADAMARRFEHGAVLANPSMQPFAFELGRLFPGVRFRRIEGAQDPEANSGEPVSAAVVVPARDGLFLLEEP